MVCSSLVNFWPLCALFGSIFYHSLSQSDPKYQELGFSHTFIHLTIPTYFSQFTLGRTISGPFCVIFGTVSHFCGAIFGQFSNIFGLFWAIVLGRYIFLDNLAIFAVK